MDPVVLGALIASIAALGGGGLATGANLWVEARRQTAQSNSDSEARVHERREKRYDEYTSALQDFYTALVDAERDTLEFEARNGFLPGDGGHDPEYKTIDRALARLHFVASDDCLAAAEGASRAFYDWGWGAGTHGDLFNSMNEFLRVVRVDLDVNTSSYKRPLPTARKRKGLPPGQVTSPKES